MEFTISNSHKKYKVKRTVNTLDDLKSIINELHPGWHNDGKTKDIIINFDNCEITIYDDYIE